MKKMCIMKKMLLIASLFLTTAVMADGPWKFKAKSADKKITLDIDLYDETIEVPDMDMFGPMNGYLAGDREHIYGTWAVTSCEVVDDTHAKLRLSNDQGSDTQDVLLTLANDSVCKVELKGTVYIKKVVDGKKLQKIGSSFELKVAR